MSHKSANAPDWREPVVYSKLQHEAAVNPALEALGYPEAWLSQGLITESDLDQQLIELTTSDDAFPEHYRWRTFQSILRNAEPEASLLGKLIVAAAADADLSYACFNALVEWVNTLPLLDQAARAFEGRFVRQSNPVAQRRLVLILESDPTDRKALPMAAREGNDAVQRRLLDAPGLPENVRALLESQGVNRAIRNLARQYKRRRTIGA